MSKTPVEQTSPEAVLGIVKKKPKKGISAKIIIPVLAVLLIGAVAGLLIIFYSTQDVNIHGNNSANIINGGIAAIQGNSIYYSNSGDFHNLYTIKTNNSGKRKINDDYPQFINVVGDRLYYANSEDENKIYSIKTNGRDRRKRKLNDDRSGDINVVGSRIYYTNNDDDGKIFSVCPQSRLLCGRHLHFLA